MHRIGCAWVLLAAVLATGPLAAGAHPSRGTQGGHPTAMGAHGAGQMGHGGVRPGRDGAPIGPRHLGGSGGGFQNQGHGHGHLHGSHFVHGGHGTGWWVVAGTWYPWYPAGEVAVPVVTGAAYYCASANAYFPAVQDCPEGWVLVLPPGTP